MIVILNWEPIGAGAPITFGAAPSSETARNAAPAPSYPAQAAVAPPSYGNAATTGPFSSAPSAYGNAPAYGNPPPVVKQQPNPYNSAPVAPPSAPAYGSSSNYNNPYNNPSYGAQQQGAVVRNDAVGAIVPISAINPYSSK